MSSSLIMPSYLSLLHASQMGSLLFHGNCTTCHFETKAVSAPSMMEVKKRYITAFSTKETFTKQMAKWVKNPNEETSIMQDAIDKYNLMPSLSFEQNTLEDIATYIYETDFSNQN